MTGSTRDSDVREEKREGMFGFLPRAPEGETVAARPLSESLKAAREEREAKKALKDAATFSDLISAVQTTGTSGKLQIIASNMSASPEPGFHLSDSAVDRWKYLDIKPDLWHLFVDARSSDHLRKLEKTALQQQQANELLSLYSPATTALLRLTDAAALVGMAVLAAGILLWVRGRRAA